MSTAPTRTVREARWARPEVEPASVPSSSLPNWAAFLLISGLYLTLRGYHAFDGDQAYRLPLLLHLQDLALYATDPFVRAFDAFNPHRSYLALLDLASRPLGLAAGLAGLFAITLGATAIGIDRLARAVWPESGSKVGLVALALVLMAKAGNVGTNHLFEATLLDRLVGFALGWLAMASAVGNPTRGVWAAVPWLGLATLIHPSVGLQLALTLAFAWVAWAIWPSRSGVSGKLAIGAIGGLGLAVLPGVVLMSGQGGRLFTGLSTEEFRLLAVMVQGPQHMLPSTWRTPQWLAWGCYPVLALLAMRGAGSGSWPASRVRLAGLMAVNLASLGLAYLAVEVVGDLRVTVFQPFRMATIARGLALVAVSGRAVALWDRGDLASRTRAVLVGVGLSGDWMLVVATAVDLAMAFVESVDRRRTSSTIVGLVVLTIGLVFLARRDTESGHWPLLAGIGTLAVGTLLARGRRFCWTPRRIRLTMAASWALPFSAAIVPAVVPDPSTNRWALALVARCRFSETPTDDLERLARWCRDHTPASSRFIGPPGPKTFRLWSRRSMAFNRAASPYHAEGLADWSSRYRDHVAFRGSTAEFARAYLADYHALEARYQAMSDTDRAALARRQGATHVLTAAPSGVQAEANGPLELLRIEGRYAVYRVRNGEQILEKNSVGPLFNPD
jgi:Domain of unknown function (DUF6798)